MIKRVLPLALLLAAACSRPAPSADGAAAPAAQPGPAYDLELAYGTRGALYLTVEDPDGSKERYLLRLAHERLGLGTLREGWQLFWADQWPEDDDDAKPAVFERGIIKVLKDPFLVLYRDGRFSIARVPHRVEEAGQELVFVSARGLFKGEIVLDYEPKAGGPKRKRAAAFVPVRKFDFRLPTKDLM